MIDRRHALPVTRQAQAAEISRGSVYYQPRPVSAADLAIMRRIDELHLDYPVRGQPDAARSAAAGGRLGRPAACRDADEADGDRGDLPPARTRQNRRQGTRFTRICCAAWWSTGLTRCGRRTSPISRWRADLSIWLPIVDWFSRRVLAHGGSRSRWTADFCIEALEEALAKYGRPKIFNTDQGSQFTSEAFTDVLLENKIAISMDGKGSWRDNVFVERLWRTREVRRGLSARLRQRVARHAHRSPGMNRAGFAGGSNLERMERWKPGRRRARGFRPRFARGRFGWFSSTRASTPRSGRRCLRLRRRSAARRRRCDCGFGGLSVTRASGPGCPTDELNG